MRAHSLIGMSFALKASAVCDRAFLEKTAAGYIQAQASGKLDSLPLAANVSYQENDVPLPLSQAVLSNPMTIDFNRTIYDTTECALFTELTAATNPHPYVISTRMLFTNDQRISTIQSVVADTGDWLFNATSYLHWTQQETWDPIPPGRRDTRSVLRAAGDAYLDSWTNATVQVPYGTPCARLEGGIYTGQRNASANSCTMPLFPEPFTISNRRYVVDEVLGAVGIFNDFPFIEKTRPEGTPSTNLFRVEGGRIRYIHEVTVCATRNCGR
ncbi:uncharacterized protein EI97DRAFT_463370 [Westerdykella ornata]|uniref:DUF8021 domain-containing protein n=1 Tax=Westerdykella ornata TaxID=318751 RepID=A0A6A6JXZ3_WESOR|nr:uncharacterized protein EI97DRAFT_463370 [Westerdykella ornata]KAF2280953.1 hypothetical protein EI97DRAFT_463370 [Westerdykella ornata]